MVLPSRQIYMYYNTDDQDDQMTELKATFTYIVEYVLSTYPAYACH